MMVQEVASVVQDWPLSAMAVYEVAPATGVQETATSKPDWVAVTDCGAASVAADGSSARAGAAGTIRATAAASTGTDTINPPYDGKC